MHIFTTIKVNFITLIGGMFVALLIGYAIGYFLRKMFTEYQIKEAEERGKKIINEANIEVVNKLKSAEIEAREKSLVVKAEFEKEMKDRQDSVRNLENTFERKERDFRSENQRFQAREKDLSEQNKKLVEMEKGIEQ
jgi:ribonuclease Y